MGKAELGHWIQRDSSAAEVGTSCRELTVLAAANFFYFQQQVNTGAACSAASQTFAHGD